MAEQQGATTEGQFAIQKIYLKDVSFESPVSPQVFTKKWEPDVNLEINTSSKGIAEDIFEVVLRLTVTVKLEGETAYLAEIHQAGIFTVKDLPKEMMPNILGAACPNILFPFGREAVADLVSKGGFPQLILSPVNFDAIFAQHQAQQAQAQQESESAEAVH